MALTISTPMPQCARGTGWLCILLAAVTLCQIVQPIHSIAAPRSYDTLPFTAIHVQTCQANENCPGNCGCENERCNGVDCECKAKKDCAEPFDCVNSKCKNTKASSAESPSPSATPSPKTGASSSSTATGAKGKATVSPSVTAKASKKDPTKTDKAKGGSISTGLIVFLVVLILVVAATFLLCRRRRKVNANLQPIQREVDPNAPQDQQWPNTF